MTTMAELIDALAKNTWLTVAASLASIIGVVLPPLIWSYRRRHRGKHVAYSMRTSPRGVRSPYGEWSLANISEISIWNSGTEIIEQGDFAKAEPLAIIVEHGEIRDAQIGFEANAANQFRLRAQGSKVLVSFDYCSPGEGVRVNLLHSAANRLIVRGVVKAYGSPEQKTKSPFQAVPPLPEGVQAPRENYRPTLVRNIPPERQLALDPVASIDIYTDRTVATLGNRLAAVALEIAILAIPTAAVVLALRADGVRHLVRASVIVLTSLSLTTKVTAVLGGTDSIGLQLIGLETLGFDGQPATRKQRIHRSVAGVASLLSAGLGYLWVLVDEEGLSWHDHISKTFVSSGVDKRGGKT